MKYKVIEWKGSRKRTFCPNKTDHKAHGWIRGRDLELFDCEGLPPPIPRCRDWISSSNALAIPLIEHD